VERIIIPRRIGLSPIHLPSPGLGIEGFNRFNPIIPRRIGDLSPSPPFPAAWV